MLDTNKSDPNRIRISLTGRVGQMVRWFLDNDPQYMRKKPQDVVEMLLERGIDVVYREGIAGADRLDSALEEELTKLSVDQIATALTDLRDGH